ncbi:hypothetical protein CTheo_3936 [Ceratobasidium theobromae]|uniref:Ribosome biogenesis protein NSA1 n=1 Tax=Ceratobasidium theobromae TaxID=1582974 RepID=A0A5N5QLH3_9AGAM|nr:hypothetical protein CTheo_3936 [Ceratobasidium theobromae]
MPSTRSYRSFVSDDKGQIKSITCEIDGKDQVQISTTIVKTQQSGDNCSSCIHKLGCLRDCSSEAGILAAASAGGRIATYSYTHGTDELKELSSWLEERAKGQDRFVGLQAFPGKGWLTCTQNGRLRFSRTLGDPSSSSPIGDVIASLPMRLNDMRLSPSYSAFTYGGDEVDLSLWDLERTFAEGPLTLAECVDIGKKRKRGKGELMYAEVWRAKQLPNDSLSLRQPVHITSLSFIQIPEITNQQPSFHIVTGNKSGAIRRFDTRVARRPVANWEGLAKVGGIRRVESGRNEHELFISDGGTSLSAIDVRNGKICYSYRGLSGAATSFAPISKSHLASTSFDRIFRLHSVFSPPIQPNVQQSKKGVVIGQDFLKNAPTAVVWDEFEPDTSVKGDQDNDDVWGEMKVREEDYESVASDESEEERKPSKSRKRMHK